jgi:hypothetical protein
MFRFYLELAVYGMRSRGTDGVCTELLVEFIPPGPDIYILFKLVYIAVAV